MRSLQAAGATLLVLATAAQAQSVEQRESRQHDRISQGVASGRLTPGEAAHDWRQQARISRDEARMRANNGGTLTAAQRSRLQYRENLASNRIYRTKHNWRHD